MRPCTLTPALVFLMFALTACDDANGERDDLPAVETTYAPELQVDLDEMETTDSGLRYRDVEAGSGTEAEAGQLVRVHYTGWLPDGNQFDSSRDRGEPFEFMLGTGQVIRGWDEGVAGMREGGRRQLVIPPELGYGAQGAGGTIPPNATLVFDVEVLQVLE